MKRIISVIIFLIVSIPLFSQLKWTLVNNDFGVLPSSVNVYKTTDSLNGRPFIAYYVEADLKNKKLDFTTEVGYGKRYTPSQYDSLLNHPIVVVNGTFFSFQTNKNLNIVMKEGQVLAYNVPSVKSKLTDSFYYPTRSAIGISNSGRADVAWLFTDTAKRWPYAFQEKPVLARGMTKDPSFRNLKTIDTWRRWKMRTAIGGGPVLVQKGREFITNKEEQMFANGIKDLHPRTAMGYTKDRKLIILAVQGRFPGKAEGASLEDEARILIDLGCEEALNLDGGGSSCLLVNGKETISPSDKQGLQRAVPAVFVILKK